MSAEGTDDLPFDDVADTGLLTLFGRVQESRSARPILRDPAAEALADALRPLCARSKRELPRRAAAGRIDRFLSVYLALRARRYDDWARAFVARHPEGAVVDLGCGLDTRFHRVDDGRLRVFDLDLPEVIRLKRRFVPESARYLMIAASVLDHAWMDEVARVAPGPFLFLAEGLFPYLEPAAAKALVLALQRRFPGAELAFETCSSRWLSPPFFQLAHFKMRRLGFGREAVYRFGIRDGRDVEGWGDGIRLLEEWCYLEADEPKLGLLRRLPRWPIFHRGQWAVRYRLDAPAAP